ncbi:uncharacterized protein LOC122365940 [Amphibalanus amphitrite]|uniref:uncharacterized protein LOC122365940 n=1 Tax=Amphibalanus amphitrite TaxID=1232801 RepID=UPI001C8FF316|nr:uncharacterized protein LOC122365940 [Amphibalanus amphitrite]
MKLSVCLLLAVVATVSADDGFYQPQAVAQSAPSAYNNYYDQQYQPPQSQGWLDRLFGSNRRQGLGGLLGGGLGIFGLIGPIALVVIAIVGLVGTAYVLSELDSSGRGLDSDQWEVDHSVWMNQLQRDFEDSWSV